jgi:ABC-type Mn2+/Zn2+ transport system permease subunit
MALGAGFGCAAVLVGLLVSWHAGTAAGASIAVVAVVSVALSRAVAAAVPTSAAAGRPTTPPSAAPPREGA